MARRSMIRVAFTSAIPILGVILASCGDNGGSATVAQPAWGAAKVIQVNASETGASPDISLNGQGDGMAVWEQFDTSGISHIRASRFDRASGWGADVPVEANLTSYSRNPQVVVDRNGDAVAVFLQRDEVTLTDRIYSTRYTTGSGWGPQTVISTDNTGDAEWPRMAIDGAGNVIAVWNQSDGNVSHVRANRYVPGTGWGTATFVVTDDTVSTQYPRVAMDNAGNALVVWQQFDGTRTNAWSNRYDAVTGSWGTPEPIQSPATVATEDVEYVRVAMNGAGTATAVWKQTDQNVWHVWSNRYSSGSWGTAMMVETENVSDAGYPRVAIDDTGNAIAVWRQLDNSIYNLYAARYAATGSAWGPATLIEKDDTGDAGWAEVAMDGAGNATVVWPHSDGAMIRANRYVVSSGWGVDVRIDASAGRTINPGPAGVAVGGGLAVAVWDQDNGTGTFNVWANLFR